MPINTVTGLALTLACGGSDDDETTSVINTAPTNVRISGLPNVGVAGHRYSLTADADGGTNVKYSTATSSTGAFANVSNQPNVWYYTPGPSSPGLHVITVTATNGDGVGKASGTAAIEVSANAVPEPFSKTGNVYSVSIIPGTAGFSANLPSLEPKDGDNVTWGGTFAGTFITAGGSVTLSGNRLTISAGAGVAKNTYTFTGLQATETAENIPTAITTPYTITVVVGDTSSGGGDGATGEAEITSYPGDRAAVQGVPFKWQFNAASRDGVNRRIIGWEVNDGISPDSTGPAPGGATIGNDGVLRFTLPMPWDEFLPSGARNPNYVAPGERKLLFGVKAILEGNVIAYQNFYFDVLSNTAPTLVNTFLESGSITTTVDTSLVASKAQWNNVYAGDSKIWFKGATPNSLNLDSKISFTVGNKSALTITDPDAWYGDEPVVKLESITVGGIGKAGTDITSLLKPYLKDGGDLTSRAINVTTTSGDMTLNDLVFTSLPVTGSAALQYKTGSSATRTLGIGGGDRIYFNYSVKDTAGQLAKYDHGNNGIGVAQPAEDEGISFAISAWVQGNQSPTIDGYPGTDNYSFGHGDGNWVGNQPTGGASSTWTLEWGTGNYKVFDSDYHSVFLNVDKIPSVTVGTGADAKTVTGNTATVSPLTLNPIAGPATDVTNWKITWTPLTEQERGQYTFPLVAWDKYGAAAYPVDVKGTVFGTITGAKVQKTIAIATTATSDTKDANLAVGSGWASIKLNPYYTSDMFKYPNQYGWEADATANVKWNHKAGASNSEWEVLSVPPGYYLVSADAKANNANVTTPVIGPAVLNIGETAAGTDAKTNLATYAYINSPNPNLSANVGFGRLSGRLDGSLSSTQYTNNVFGTGTAVPANVVYRGLWNNVGAGAMSDGDVIQFVLPSNNQKRFIYPTALVSQSNAYPGLVAATYPQNTTLLWYPVSNTATEATSANNGLNYYPFQFTVPTTMRQLAAATDTASFSVLKRNTSSGMIEGAVGPGAITYQYWKLEKSAITSGMTYGSSFEQQAVNFLDESKEGKNFKATIDRGTFVDALKTSLPGTAGALNDSLQIVSYTNTAAGPQFAQGLPTLVEFGNLRTQVLTVENNIQQNADAQNGVSFIDMGTIKIPTPQAAAWIASAGTPVVHYTAAFGGVANSRNLGGSMGLVTEDVEKGIYLAQDPVTDIAITVSPYSGNVRTLADASAIISSHVNGTAPTWPIPVSAAAFAEDGKENSSVYLTWKDPSGDFSGHIIEFFEVGMSGSNLGNVNATATPLYKVHVGRDTQKFPIPMEWVKTFEGTTSKNIVVRFKTVKYGENGSLVDFNKTPFMTALPYAWVDTVTTNVRFENITPDTSTATFTFARAGVDITATGLTVGLGDAYVAVDTVHKNKAGTVFVPNNASEVTWEVTAGATRIELESATGVSNRIKPLADATTGAATVTVTYSPSGSEQIVKTLNVNVAQSGSISFTGQLLPVAGGNSMTMAAGSNTNVVPIIKTAAGDEVFAPNGTITWTSSNSDIVGIGAANTESATGATMKLVATNGGRSDITVEYQPSPSGTKITGTLSVTVTSAGAITFGGSGVTNADGLGALTVRIGDPARDVAAIVSVNGGANNPAATLAWAATTDTVKLNDAYTAITDARNVSVAGFAVGKKSVNVTYTDTSVTPNISIPGTLVVTVNPGGTLALKNADGGFIDKTTVNTVVGAASDFIVTGVPTRDGANISTPATWAWSSDDTSIVAVQSGGTTPAATFRPLAPGTAEITATFTHATYGAMSSSFTVNVSPTYEMSFKSNYGIDVTDGNKVSFWQGENATIGGTQVTIDKIWPVGSGAQLPLPIADSEVTWTLKAAGGGYTPAGNIRLNGQGDPVISSAVNITNAAQNAGTDIITVSFQRTGFNGDDPVTAELAVTVNALGTLTIRNAEPDNNVAFGTNALEFAGPNSPGRRIQAVFTFAPGAPGSTRTGTVAWSLTAPAGLTPDELALAESSVNFNGAVTSSTNPTLVTPRNDGPGASGWNTITATYTLAGTPAVPAYVATLGATVGLDVATLAVPSGAAITTANGALADVDDTANLTATLANAAGTNHPNSSPAYDSVTWEITGGTAASAAELTVDTGRQATIKRTGSDAGTVTVKVTYTYSDGTELSDSFTLTLTAI